MDHNGKRHAVYLLTCHMVFVTKYRKQKKGREALPWMIHPRTTSVARDFLF
ncbi:hypothetical protein [Eubacterium sp. An3]|uniref:hypothetical protein n=1 Tax=Eubacterium sp. An3 TaxID=1965628 RepID=UPI0013029D51|nr:hypothetical protein [Eubacterium sp. An3]